MGGRQSGAAERRQAHSQDGVPGQLAVYLARAGGGKSMTQDEIIEMARQAGFIVGEPWREILIERFAKLVAQHEREACAKVCEKTPPWPFKPSIEAAHAIRARGQA